MSNPLTDKKLFATIKQKLDKTAGVLSKIRVSSSGTIYRHSMGKIPGQITLIPVMSRGVAPTVCVFYKDPDSENLYLKSSTDGWFWISVSGG